jgi:exodeoxyribonuclease VII small subunit
MAAKKTTQPAPAGYAEAMREIESILSELDSSSIDVDVLATKVERASFLITWCNERITAAQLTVDTLVADIDFDEDGDGDEYEDEDDDE